MTRGLLAGVFFGVLVAALILAVAALQLESRKPAPVVMILPEVLVVFATEVARAPLQDQGIGWGTESPDRGRLTRLTAPAMDLPVAQPVFAAAPPQPLPAVPPVPAPQEAPQPVAEPPIVLSQVSMPSDSIDAPDAPRVSLGAWGAVGLPLAASERVALGEGIPLALRPEIAVPVPPVPSAPMIETENPFAPVSSLYGAGQSPRVSPQGDATGPLRVEGPRLDRAEGDTMPPEVSSPELFALHPPGMSDFDTTDAEPRTAAEGAGSHAPIGAKLRAGGAALSFDAATRPSDAAVVTTAPEVPLSPPQPASVFGTPLDTPPAPAVAADAAWMAIVLHSSDAGDFATDTPDWLRSVALDPAALSTPPAGLEVLPVVPVGADRGALSGVAWDMARLDRPGPLFVGAPLADAQATQDLLGLARVAKTGLLLAGQGVALLPDARSAAIPVAAAYPAMDLSARLARAAIHARRDGAVVLVIEDSAAARVEVSDWLAGTAADGIVMVSVAQALSRLGTLLMRDTQTD